MIGLVKIYRTDDRKIHEEDELTEGVWVQMVNPSEGEGEEYARKLDVDISDLLILFHQIKNDLSHLGNIRIISHHKIKDQKPVILLGRINNISI